MRRYRAGAPLITHRRQKQGRSSVGYAPFRYRFALFWGSRYLRNTVAWRNDPQAPEGRFATPIQPLKSERFHLGGRDDPPSRISGYQVS